MKDYQVIKNTMCNLFGMDVAESILNIAVQTGDIMNMNFIHFDVSSLGLTKDQQLIACNMAQSYFISMSYAYQI